MYQNITTSVSVAGKMLLSAVDENGKGLQKRAKKFRKLSQSSKVIIIVKYHTFNTY